ncbi:MAG: pantoate--beta-alanine ligase [Polyangiales bacterium]
MTTLLRAPVEYRRACEEARAASRRVGLVPTMGALHAGHLSLIEEAARRCDFVVVTVFVNPLQFGAGEDLDRYPRTLERDLEACRAHGVNVVFAPERDAMYPRAFQSSVRVGDLTKPLEGEFRPEHFDGVTTVVTKLFNLTGSCTAVFGRKDYQQWTILRRMVRDLDMPIDVIGCPIVREPDGLAMSSRNRYLSAHDRTRALSIVEGLRAVHDAWGQGEYSAHTLEKVVAAPVIAAFDRVDYVAVVDADTLEPASPDAERLLVAVAAHLGSTRLIDNVVLGEDPRP